MEKYICENLPRLINACGLVFDIIGVFLLWKFGLPESISREGHQYLVTADVSESEKEKAKKYDHNARIALILIILGFILQLLSDFL